MTQDWRRRPCPRWPSVRRTWWRWRPSVVAAPGDGVDDAISDEARTGDETANYSSWDCAVLVIAVGCQLFAVLTEGESAEKIGEALELAGDPLPGAGLETDRQVVAVRADLFAVGTGANGLDRSAVSGVVAGSWRPVFGLLDLDDNQSSPGVWPGVCHRASVIMSCRHVAFAARRRRGEARAPAFARKSSSRLVRVIVASTTIAGEHTCRR